MSINRKAAKRDKNEKEIIEVLRLHGASVFQLSGKGVPDLLVSYRGKNYLLEVKSGKGKLTPDQEQFHLDWQGEIHIVRSADEAVEIIKS